MLNALRVALAAVVILVSCGRGSDDERKEHRELTDLEAAKETEIDGLRLVHDSAIEPAGAVHVGYVETDTRPGSGRYLCGAMSNDASRSTGNVIADQISRLPDSSMKRLGLKYVILCSRAEAAGRRIGGIPVPPLHLLMLNVGGSTPDDAYLRHIFLHELYHLIEFRFNAFQDDEWQQRFGTGYANEYGVVTQRTTPGSGKPGFLNGYSESFPHEERAELFASLLLDPGEIPAHIQATNDGVLREKARYVAEKSARLIGFPISLP